MNKFIQFFHYSFSFRPAIYSYKTTVKKNILVQNYKVEKARTNEKRLIFSFSLIFTKKPEKWKKHSVSIIVLAIVLEKISPRVIWISKVTSVEKRELRKHFSASACSFLGLGLRPRPQKFGLGFEKRFLSSLFSTSVT